MTKKPKYRIQNNPNLLHDNTSWYGKNNNYPIYGYRADGDFLDETQYLSDNQHVTLGNEPYTVFNQYRGIDGAHSVNYGEPIQKNGKVIRHVQYNNTAFNADDYPEKGFYEQELQNVGNKKQSLWKVVNTTKVPIENTAVTDSLSRTFDARFGRALSEKKGGILKRVNKHQYGGNTPMVNPMYQFNAMDRDENGNPNEHHWLEYLMPGYGTMLSTNDYMNKPSFGNFISAALSGVGDLFGLKGLNALRGAKALGKQASTIGNAMNRSGLDFTSVRNGYNNFYDLMRKNGIKISDANSAGINWRMGAVKRNGLLFEIDESSDLWKKFVAYTKQASNGNLEIEDKLFRQGYHEIVSKVADMYDDLNKTARPYFDGLRLSSDVDKLNREAKMAAGVAAASDAASVVGKNGGSR